MTYHCSMGSGALDRGRSRAKIYQFQRLYRSLALIVPGVMRSSSGLFLCADRRLFIVAYRRMSLASVCQRHIQITRDR